MSKNNISIEINDIKYQGILDCDVNISMLGFNRNFIFSIPPEKKNLFNISDIDSKAKIQDEIKLYIDDNLILTGYVEKFDINYSASGQEIILSGRDKTGDLADSNIKQNNYNIRDLQKLITRVLIDNDITNIKVINKTNSKILLDQDEKIETEAEETIFNFIDRYCRKGQVLSRSNEDGDIILERENTDISIGSLINEKDNANNNIVSARYTANTSDRYRFIDVYSQSNNNYHTEQAVNQKANIIDRGIERSRRKIIVFNDATTSAFLKSFAEWLKNLKIAKSQNYSCKVQGFYINDNLILPNKIISIKDDIVGFNSDYLIQDVSFNYRTSGIFATIRVVKIGLFSNSEVTAGKQDINISNFL